MCLSRAPVRLGGGRGASTKLMTPTFALLSDDPLLGAPAVATFSIGRADAATAHNLYRALGHDREEDW